MPSSNIAPLTRGGSASQFPPSNTNNGKAQHQSSSAPASPACERNNLLFGADKDANGGGPQTIDASFNLKLFSAGLKKEQVKFNDLGHKTLHLDSKGTLVPKSENFIFRITNKFSQWFFNTKSFTQHNLEVSFVMGLKSLYLHPDTSMADCYTVKSDLNSFKTEFVKYLIKDKDTFANKLHEHLLQCLERHNPCGSSANVPVPAGVDISDNRLLTHILKDVFEKGEVPTISFFNIEICLNKCLTYCKDNKLTHQETIRMRNTLDNIQKNFSEYFTHEKGIGGFAKTLFNDVSGIVAKRELVFGGELNQKFFGHRKITNENLYECLDYGLKFLGSNAEDPQLQIIDQFRAQLLNIERAFIIVQPTNNNAGLFKLTNLVLKFISTVTGLANNVKGHNDAEDIRSRLEKNQQLFDESLGFNVTKEWAGLSEEQIDVLTSIYISSFQALNSKLDSYNRRAAQSL
ncbi:MAG: hypothetical protein KBD37_06910 [Burkholderiales bacterium]|nr:hypothetical protein [Burkholderiales bacterium]